MKFTDWKDELEANGYVVTEDLVTTKRGDVLAGKDPYGGYYVNDSMVQAILAKPVVQKEDELEVVRARTKDGKFIPDDPATPTVNEAWTTRPRKKVAKK